MKVYVLKVHSSVGWSSKDWNKGVFSSEELAETHGEAFIAENKDNPHKTCGYEIEEWEVE